MRFSLKQLIVISIITSVLIACAANDTNEQPIELVDFQHEAQIEVLWDIDTGSGSGKYQLALQPYLDSENLYIADYKGKISAYNKTTGKTIWQVKSDFPVSAGVGGGGGLLFVGTADGRLIAFNQNDGQIVWETELSSELLSIPSRGLGVVVARTVDGSIQAFSASAGERLWSYKQSVPSLSLRGNASPIISGGLVISGSDNGVITALSLSEGRVVWETRIAAPGGRSELDSLVDIDSAPKLDKGILYTGAYQGRVAAVTADEGQTIWARDKSVNLGLSLDSENIYAVDELSHIWALDRNSGATLWVQEKLHARPVTATVVNDQYVLTADFEGYIHVLAKDDGRLVARKKLGGDRFIATPLIDNGIYYALNQKGKLAALKIVAN